MNDACCVVLYLIKAYRVWCLYTENYNGINNKTHSRLFASWLTYHFKVAMFTCIMIHSKRKYFSHSLCTIIRGRIRKLLIGPLKLSNSSLFISWIMITPSYLGCFQRLLLSIYLIDQELNWKMIIIRMSMISEGLNNLHLHLNFCDIYALDLLMQAFSRVIEQETIFIRVHELIVMNWYLNSVLV